MKGEINMNKAKITMILLSLVIFLIGVLSGVFLERIIGFNFGNMEKHPFFVKYRKNNQPMMKMFQEKLKLNKDQADKVYEIMEKHRKEMDSFRENNMKEMERIKKTIDKEIRLILSEEQKIIFKKITNKIEKHKKKHRK